MHARCISGWAGVLRTIFATMIGAAGAISAIGIISVMGGCGAGRTDLSVQYWQATQALPKVAALEKSKTKEELAIIDVRSPADFALEHLPGAVNLTLADFATGSTRGKRSAGEVYLVEKDAILIYANDPGSAVPRAMAKRLMRLEYDDVYVLQGGFLAWKRAGGDGRSGAGAN